MIQNQIIVGVSPWKKPVAILPTPTGIPPISQTKDPMEAVGLHVMDRDIIENGNRIILINKKIKIKNCNILQEFRNSFLHCEEAITGTSRPIKLSRCLSCPALNLISPPPPPPLLPRRPTAQREITTYMIRNIPTRFTSLTFVKLLDEYGFKSTFNFFYLPMDFRSGKNMGYAFINFEDPHHGERFMERFNMKRLPVSTSRKVLEISPSRRQGLSDNISLFRTSDLLNSVSLPHYKPLVVDKSSGELVPLSEGNFPDV